MNAAVICVRDLSVGWGDTVILRGMSFDVFAGEVFVILGRSGSGKTTVLRHLVGLDVPISGDIRVLGEAPATREPGPPRFGVTFQSGALFGSLTVAENVALPLEEWTDFSGEVVSAMVRAKLDVVGLYGASEKFPAQLSGGMKKRAAIARAMITEPEILFLDEPSSGLDPMSTSALDELLLTLNRALGLTVVIVSHDLTSVFRIATRCILIDRETQSIIASGDPRALREASTDPRVRAFFTGAPIEEEV
jgi:phospholipid/cholesterol/gamma-HCH transport system ATP-binding protein